MITKKELINIRDCRYKPVKGQIYYSTITIINSHLEALAEIVKLLEAEDKTLTLLAADLDVPLHKAMKIADYGKKEYKERVLAELPEDADENIDDLYFSIQAKAKNACLAEVRRLNE